MKLFHFFNCQVLSQRQFNKSSAANEIGFIRHLPAHRPPSDFERFQKPLVQNVKTVSQWAVVSVQALAIR